MSCLSDAFNEAEMGNVPRAIEEVGEAAAGLAESHGIAEEVRATLSAAAHGHPFQAVTDFVRSDQVAASNRRALQDIAESQKRFPNKSFDQSLEHARYTLAARSPVIRTFVLGNQLNVTELGTGVDVTVPKVLGNRLANYVSLELFDDARTLASWNKRLAEEGLSVTNKIRVLGNAAEQPIATGSQDLVFAAHVPTFFFTGPPDVIAKNAISESARVLKPGGKFILYDFSHFDERNGISTLTQYFPKFQIHSPTALELSDMEKAGTPYLGSSLSESRSRFDQYLRAGDFRSFVGVKTE